MNEFTPIAQRDDLPDGAGHLVEIEGRNIALFRIGRTVHALDNVCPHLGASLAEGLVDGSEVVCPWHGWRFRLSDGRCSTFSDCSVAVHSLRIDRSTVLVRLGSEQSPEQSRDRTPER